jgi:hypothetical protein
MYLQAYRAVPSLRRLVTGFSRQRPSFAPRSVYMLFVMDKLALGQVLLQVFQFPPVNIIPTLYHIHSQFHKDTVSSRRNSNNRSVEQTVLRK